MNDIERCIHVLRGNLLAGLGSDAIAQRDADIAILQTLRPACGGLDNQGEVVLKRARKVLQRADDEYELLAAPDGTVAIEMNLLRALIALAAIEANRPTEQGLGALSGSQPTAQAPAGLGASRVDPERVIALLKAEAKKHDDYAAKRAQAGHDIDATVAWNMAGAVRMAARKVAERFAIVDTHPKDGDALAAPLVSGDGAKQSPDPSSPTSVEQDDER